MNNKVTIMGSGVRVLLSAGLNSNGSGRISGAVGGGDDVQGCA